MADTMLFFTELLGMPVYDVRGRRIGKIKDAALVPVVHASRIDRFLLSAGGVWLSIRYDQVAAISLEGVHLSEEILTPYHDDEYMLRIARDLLDQQIIDVNGRKVVRVTDVTMEVRREGSHEIVTLVEVDVGIRSIFRRLAQGVLPVKWIRQLQQPIPPNSIRWEFCNIVEADPQRRLRLNISNQMLETMHPADLADIVEELSPAERESIFETLDSEVAADALSEVENPKMQASILESLEPEVAADIVEEMSPDEAADVLNELQDETSEEILEEMQHQEKTEVRELLEYDEDTAGGMMNTEYVTLPKQATVADAITAIRANEDLLDSLNTLFLIDEDGRLVHTVPVSRLFIAAGGRPLMELTGRRVIQVHVDTQQKRVTEIFDKYNLLALPVSDAEGKLAGVITADDVISVLRQK